MPKDVDLAGMCDVIAGLPLLFQPGSEWNYSMGLDVLGRVLEVVSGQPLDELMRTRLLEPLGMHETTWHVPEANHVASPGSTARNPATRMAVPLDKMGDAALRPPQRSWRWRRPAEHRLRLSPVHTDAGQRRRSSTVCSILSPRTVRYMASNHLPGNADLTAFGRPLFSETTFDGVGFGLGVSVTIDPVKGRVPGNAGEFAWGGAASTAFWVDPVDDLTVSSSPSCCPAARTRFAAS